MAKIPSNYNQPQLNAEPRSPVSFQISGKVVERTLDLPDGLQLAQYTNANQHIYYQNDSQHTFSLYLQGGFTTHRTDQSSPNGAPSHYCLMPQESYSAWDVGNSQQFFHLYFSDSYLKRLAMRTFDIDPRRVDLPERSFDHNKALDAVCRHSLLPWEWHFSENQLAIEQTIQTIMILLLKTTGISDTRLSGELKSGLSPIVQNRLIEYIDAHHTHQISLSDLASLAGLSEYHLCRMFKVSFAETPQQLIMRKRVESVKKHLDQTSTNSEKRSLADIALLSGFSNQSHMGRTFKKYSGITPGQYARCN